MSVIFDNNGLAEEAGEIKCFYYDSSSHEYLGWSDEYINIGVSMPGNSTVLNPGEEIEGHVHIFNGAGWESVEDHRGEVAYLKSDGFPYTVSYVGPLRSDMTFVKPSTPYDEWNGNAWITNEENKKNDAIRKANDVRDLLIDDATAYMNNKQWPGKAVIGRLKGEELTQYEIWLDYLDALDSVDTSDAPDVTWPDKPTA